MIRLERLHLKKKIFHFFIRPFSLEKILAYDEKLMRKHEGGRIVPMLPMLISGADPAHTKTRFDERTEQGLLIIFWEFRCERH